MIRRPFLMPSFVVGVTGNIDPQRRVLDGNKPAEDVRKTIQLIFEFLEYGAQAEAGALFQQIRARLPRPEHAPGLEQWPGLGRTPLVVLTSLAPGADSIVAEVALKKGLAVRAPLPFPKSVYRNASTFVSDRSWPSESDRAAQAHFDHLTARIGDENVFAVRLAEEIHMDQATLEARMADDVHDETARHRRYRAAGEYVASHCDLLLALWDDDDPGKTEGSSGIVQVKLRGVTPELLPTGTSFTWANCGPVLHVYMPRRKNLNALKEYKLGRMRLLHAAPLPKDLLETPAAFLDSLDGAWLISQAYWGSKGRRWRAYKKWQLSGNQLLCRIAKSLGRFNAGYRDTESPELLLRKMLDPAPEKQPNGLPAPVSLAQDLKTQAPEFFDALTPLVAARRHSADTSRQNLRRRSRRALLGMFVLIFGFAVCLHLFFHWRAMKGGSLVKSGEVTEITIPAEHGEEANLRANFPFGVAGIGFGIMSLALFWWHRRGEVEESDQDYRSLAEGLRVQIAWCIAGLYRSAAAHYMERQRNEMDWIRCGLSSLSMPYHRWNRWFCAVEMGLQLRLLRWTHAHWVSEQARYHHGRADEHAHNHHALHKLSGALALCGALQTVALVYQARWPFLKEAQSGEWGDLPKNVAHFGKDACLALTLWFLILWLWKLLPKFNREFSPRDALKTILSWKAVSAAFLPACRLFMNWVVPTPHPKLYQSRQARSGRMILAFLAHLPLATALGVFLIALAVTPSVGRKITPDPEALITILSGVFLLLGALLVGWTEKNLLSEQAYRFSAMASLFSAAKIRLDECLREAEEAHGRNDAFTRDERIRQAQQMLYDLGIEALDENAEWLILHRARPMEPMMAG
jgi:hypothetical protein